MSDLINGIYRLKCAEPSDINEHLPVLKEYSSRCQTVTEFGFRTGVSTWALLAGGPVSLISYDLQSPPSWTLDLMTESSIGAFKFIQANVLGVVIDYVDLLFIDTFHTANQLRAELGINGIRAKKWIIMHDTTTFGEKDEAGEGPGLNQAIREFLASNPSWFEKERFTNNNGLTVLERK